MNIAAAPAGRRRGSQHREESIGMKTESRTGGSGAAARNFKPSSPSPWKLYGEVRGLKAPPRRTAAPPFFTLLAIE